LFVQISKGNYICNDCFIYLVLEHSIYFGFSSFIVVCPFLSNQFSSCYT